MGIYFSPLAIFFSHWRRFPQKCDLTGQTGLCGYQGALVEGNSAGFVSVFYTPSFLFLERRAWPPVQRNDLGFKCEMPAQSECLKKAFSARPRGEGHFVLWDMWWPPLDHLPEVGCCISDTPASPLAGKDISVFPFSTRCRQPNALLSQVVIQGKQVVTKEEVNLTSAFSF